jgi:hypothetical protein
MQVATDEKGNEIYVRPKLIMMAFTEWMLIFDMVLVQVMLILFMLTIL